MPRGQDTNNHPNRKVSKESFSAPTCDTCGYNTATQYFESPNVHEEGQGEYMCDSCAK